MQYFSKIIIICTKICTIMLRYIMMYYNNSQLLIWFPTINAQNNLTEFFWEERGWRTIVLATPQQEGGWLRGSPGSQWLYKPGMFPQIWLGDQQSLRSDLISIKRASWGRMSLSPSIRAHGSVWELTFNEYHFCSTAFWQEHSNIKKILSYSRYDRMFVKDWLAAAIAWLRYYSQWWNVTSSIT